MNICLYASYFQSKSQESSRPEITGLVRMIVTLFHVFYLTVNLNLSCLAMGLYYLFYSILPLHRGLYPIIGILV